MAAVVAVGWLGLSGCGSSTRAGTDGGMNGDGASPDAPPASSRIAGTVTGYALSAVDSDVNDPNAPFAANDSVATAQAVTVPFTLGGYLNAPGAGPDGRSKDAGDVIDVYRVSATAGQIVMMSFDTDDPVGLVDARNALQIYLLDLNGDPVLDGDGFPVEGRYNAETLRYFFIDQGGDYLIAVEAIKGASTYVLAVDDYHGDGMAAAPAPYVPGQIVARFRPGAVPNTLRPGEHHRGLDVRAGAPQREMLLAYDAKHPDRFLGHWGGSHLIRPAGALASRRRPLRGPITPRTAAMLVHTDASVSVAGANFILRPTLVPDDQYYGNQWEWENIHAEAAWDNGSGSGVIVAVVDTGADLSHPDLQANLVPGYDFVRDVANAGDGDGLDPNPQQTNSGNHGTHVAGTIAAVTNNNRGVAGLAWGAKVMPLRAMGNEGGTEYDVGQAVRFAAGLDNDSGTLPTTPARVVNMSLGGPENSRWFQRTVYDAVRAGTVIVAASGNDNSSAPSYPAAYDHVVSVASTTSSNNKSGFSNYGPTIDVAAPGSQILSTWGGGGYNIISGTSMACPHAAAWVALMLGTNPALTAADIEAIIANEDVFTDLGQAGRDDYFGYGLIDAQKAVAVASAYSAGAAVVIPELGMTPDQVILGPMQNSVTVSGINIGDGTLNVTAATPSAGWLSASNFMPVANGVELSVSVDRGQLGAPGIYESAVLLDVDGELHELPVFVIVRENTQPSDLGALYVSLVDGNGDTWATADVRAARSSLRPCPAATTGSTSARISTMTPAPAGAVKCAARTPASTAWPRCPRRSPMWRWSPTGCSSPPSISADATEIARHVCECRLVDILRRALACAACAGLVSGCYEHRCGCRADDQRVGRRLLRAGNRPPRSRDGGRHGGARRGFERRVSQPGWPGGPGRQPAAAVAQPVRAQSQFLPPPGAGSQLGRRHRDPLRRSR